MRLEVPIRMESYRSPADVSLRFVKDQCLPKSPPAFQTRVELLFHGHPSTKEDRIHILDPEEKEAAIGKAKVPKKTRINGGSKGIRVHRKEERRRRRRRRRNMSSNPKEHPKANLSLGVAVPSTKEGGSLKTRSPWVWQDEFQVVTFQVLQDLYSKVHHSLRFGCEFLGPAGVYSVRIVSDVPSSPTIATSSVFTVEWSEEFSIRVPTRNIIPCSWAIPVTYTAPACVGNSDKVRVYAHEKANVTSANPPVTERYVTERRAVNRSTTFHCRFFSQEAAEYCFVYVNTASTGAVTRVREQCVPTFKPYVVRFPGSWSSWNDWSDCSAPCGRGQRLRFRFCDDPPPMNGGRFCQGNSLDTEPCEGSPCKDDADVVSAKDVSSSVELWEDACSCGCHIRVEPSTTSSIAASATQCGDVVAHWLLQAPANRTVRVETRHVSLAPGFQWLKLRDGNSSTSPLLASYPRRSWTGGSREHFHSRDQFLLVQFYSDINASLWPSEVDLQLGFSISAQVEDKVDPTTLESINVWGVRMVELDKIGYAHMVSGLFLMGLFLSVAALAAYHCHRYPSYKRSKRARLTSDSPLETPPNSPNHEIARNLLSSSSTSTLTEILSLKSLRLPLRRDSNCAYERLPSDAKSKGASASSPSSPALRESKKYVVRMLLKQGNNTRKRRNRRSASFDHFDMRDISPIHEEVPSYSLDNLADSDKKAGKFPYTKGDFLKSSEDYSAKYKEHRKSMENLEGKGDLQKTETPKSSKNRENLERLRKSFMSKLSLETTVNAASSVTELTGSCPDQELEYDYYDYNMDNASAVPGSLFGLDPTLMPWLPPFLTIAEEEQINIFIDASTPSREDNTGATEGIEMELLNIAPADTLQQSLTSNDSNSQDNDDKTELAESDSVNGKNERSPDTEQTLVTKPSSEIKILNVDDFEDFTFADESEEEGD